MGLLNATHYKQMSKSGAIGAINPKSVYDVLDATPVRGGVSAVEREFPMLKAFSKKYRGRAILVGNTSFSFDEDGYCSVANVGNTSIDFQSLLTKNHVSCVVEEDLEEVSGVPREADTREGIDEELLAAPEEEEELDDEEEEPEEDLLDEEEALEEVEESEDSDD